MFDLERHINEWRQTTSREFRGQTSTLDELENHLRDAVDALMKSGSSPEQAWNAALSRFGASEPLAVEFRKLSAWSTLSWLPVQLTMALYGCFAIWLAWFVVRVANNRGDALLGFHVFFITVGYTAVFAVGAIAIWSIVSRALRGWTASEQVSLRSAIYGWTAGGLALTLLGFVLGAIWAHGQWGHFWNWDAREMTCVALLLWNAAVMGSLIWRPRNERLAMLLGLAGNLVVAACWFGPAVFGAGLRAYGSIPTMFVGLAAILLLVAGGLTWLALLPRASLRRHA